jgi:dipeptide/tripeptide permease
VAVGTGGIKPNVSAFGADQFDDNNRKERKEKQSFFNWFYLVINVGSLVACTVIIWIQVRFMSVCLFLALLHSTVVRRK